MKEEIADQEGSMNIPTTVPFDKVSLDKLWARVNHYKGTLGGAERAVLREELSAIFNSHRQSVGLAPRSYAGTTELFGDLAIFYRIAKINEKDFRPKTRVMVDGTPGIVEGMTKNGYLTVSLDYGSARTQNLEPKLVERLSL